MKHGLEGECNRWFKDYFYAACSRNSELNPRKDKRIELEEVLT